MAVSMSAGTSIEATFCFVDIAGYTALTDTHGERAAADLVDEFAELVRASILPSGQLQSLIGDCAFIVFADPVVAAGALSALYTSIAGTSRWFVPVCITARRFFAGTTTSARR